MKRLFLITLPAILMGLNTFAQTLYGLNSGRIEFDISFQDDRLDPQTKSMMPSECVMYFKEGNARVEMKMAMGLSTTISDNTNGKSYVLIDMMGNKMAMEVNHSNRESKEDKEQFKVEHLNEEKQIAGYKCHKARVTQLHENKPYTFDIWYSKEIPAVNTSSNGINGIDGCMLEFEMNQSGTRMKMTARKIEKMDVAPEKFRVPSDYQIMKQEDMKHFMGGGK